MVDINQMKSILTDMELAWDNPVWDRRQRKIFRIDDYGSDSTGKSLSDNAYVRAYQEAVASIEPSVSGGPTSGAMVHLGPGLYQFSPNVVKVSDPRIGLKGPGSQACCLYTKGNGGDLVYVTDTSPGRSGTAGAAPVGGFQLFGWQSGSNTNGLHYGDRSCGRITDILSAGFNSPGCRAFLFRNDNGGLMEGSSVEVSARQSTICYDFDGSNANGSFDYGRYILHAVGQVFSNDDIAVLRVINQAHMFACNVALRGNLSNSNAGKNAVAVQIGGSTSDTARIVDSVCQVGIECDGSTGSCKDLVVTGNSSAGIYGGSCQFSFLDASGSWSAGSVGGSALVRGWGSFQGPIFSSVGTKTALGSANALLSTYVNA